MSSDERERLAFKAKLNQISPSFCAAKWLQVTLHLYSGYNHSCHHPWIHQTPLDELAQDPSALHNTRFKKELRQMMLDGKRPSECDYCWRIEDLGQGMISDRVLKSAEDWAAPHLEKLRSMPAQEHINPTYVEVSFSNVCNFRCSYCSADFSTRWVDDLKRNGNYSTGSGTQTVKVLEEEENPYIEAFWKWWPDLVKDLRVFRITGGEPLLSKNTFKVLEELARNPRPDLEIAINSNLGVSDEIFQKFISYAKDLTENKKVKRLRLYTSAEAWEERAEYIRNGLEFARFKKNIELYLSQVPLGRMTIMATYNALSVTSFKKFLEYVVGIRNSPLSRVTNQLNLDISYLRHPEYQSVQILPRSYQSLAMESLKYMKEHSAELESSGFSYDKVVKLERICELMKTTLPENELQERRRNFYRFFSEHDKRRGTDFVATFPEMKDFWDTCKSLI